MNAGGTTKGFDDAFDQLYQIAYRAAFRILGSREDAEDVAIEVLARASVRWQRIDKDPAPWVATVAVNLSLDMWRRRRRAPEPETPREVCADVERRTELSQALDRLPKRQRDTVVLRYFLDLTESETAAAMGVSVGTIKQHASRAMVSLRRDLGGEDS
jgi:RNA polymerase sigma-70 factor (sigma-E family)